MDAETVAARKAAQIALMAGRWREGPLRRLPCGCRVAAPRPEREGREHG